MSKPMPDQDRTLSNILSELANSFTTLFKAELNLAKVELKQNARAAAKRSAMGVGFTVVAWFGLHALLIAAVIGMGELLGGHYGWGALIVGLILTAGGGFFAFKAFQKVPETANLEKSQRSMMENRAMIKDQVQEISTGVKQAADELKQQATHELTQRVS